MNDRNYSNTASTSKLAGQTEDSNNPLKQAEQNGQWVHSSTIAFNAGSLWPLAESVCSSPPNVQIVVAANDSREAIDNLGAAKRAEETNSIDIAIAAPRHPGEFNALQVAIGLEGVAIGTPVDSETSLPPNPQEEVARLSKLGAIEYDQEREQAAKALGIRVSTLDGLVKKTLTESETNEATNTLDFEEPTLWPDPIDGALLLDEIEQTVRRHTITAKHVPATVALWVVFTWMIDGARVAPILAITSPEKRCGKTTLLELVGLLARKGLLAANISQAAVFRTVDKWMPTLLIDEADTFLRQNDELRGVLNSGHTRSSAFVIRTVGDDHEPRRFSTWGAKGVAMIGKLPDTLADRAIPVAMRRKLPSETVTRLRGDPFEPLRQRLARFAEDNLAAIKRAEPELPEGINDRAADNWEPLLAIADQAGGIWPQKARTAAFNLSGASAEVESVGTMLLADMRRLLTETNALSSTKLADKLAELEDRPWPEFGSSKKAITPARVARILGEFKISPEKLPGNFGYKKGTRGYTLDSARDAFARYLPPAESGEVPHANTHGASGDFQGAAPTPCTALLKTPDAHNGGRCGTSPLSRTV